jgi:hypothetical protein
MKRYRWRGAGVTTPKPQALAAAATTAIVIATTNNVEQLR